jgi:protein-tyrosine phosphatase
LNGKESPSKFKDRFYYRNLEIKDGVFEELNEEFWNSISYVKEVIKKGGKILAHCRMGISRSPAFCIAYLMDDKRISYDEAFSIVKKKRPNVNINSGFERQIRLKFLEMPTRTY